MPEASLPVADLIRWCTRADAGTLRPLLIGCDLDDGRSDTLLPIIDANIVDRVLVVANNLRVPLRTVSAGAIVDPRPGSPLLAAYAASRTPAERQEAAERTRLARLGVNPDRLASSEDRHIVLTFLTALDGSELNERTLPLGPFYEAMKRSGDPTTYRRAAMELSKLAATCAGHGSRPPETLPWRIAWFLNRTGQYEEAIAVSETPEARHLQELNRAYMASIRASALISLGTARRDAALLNLAERSIKAALAAGSDPEMVKRLYGALRAAQAQLSA